MKIVIVGNGMVGYKFCEKLMAKVKPGSFQLIVFGEEARPAYDRVHLSEYFAGKTAEDLTMAPASWYADNNITLHLGDPVQSIDRTNKTILSFHGISETYDYLILATGSSAFVPPIPGVDKKGVFIYRTIEDLELMTAFAKKARSGAVIGGGLLGLEAAKAMLDLGMTDTKVIEFAPRLMPRQVDDAGSKILQAKIEKLGLKVYTSKNTSEIVGDESITGLRFADNTHIPVDMLVISAGIKPRDELATLAGLEVGQRGGIVVNDHMQTTDPNIFAIGECVLHQGMVYGLVAPGYEMAEVVATRLAGGEKTFTGYDMSTKLKLIGVDVASFGDPFVPLSECRTVVFEDTMKGIYKRINITPDGKQLLGGVLIGDADSYNMLLQTTKNKLALPPNPEDLVLGSRAGAETATSGPASLPMMLPFAVVKR
jgi:nitrite reductase (NADH) large subunit